MNKNIKYPARQMLDTIRTQLLPLVRNGAPIVMLQPPPAVISYGNPNIGVREVAGAALPASHGIGGDMRAKLWREANLNAFNIPYWGCVLEGEADLVVGATRSMCRTHRLKPARWIVSLPQGTFFWLPPGVPITMSGIHWERPEPEKAHCRIFWMHVTDSGASCHFCSMANGNHWTHPYAFSPSTYLLPQARRITQELEDRRSDHQQIISHLLQVLLLDTVRGFQARGEEEAIAQTRTWSISDEDTAAVVQRALQFINDRLGVYGLKVSDVAHHARISETHLGRLFREHLQCSVREVIIDKRLEMARELLEKSTFNVRQICAYCGYRHVSTFIAAFEKRYGNTPAKYRHEFQNK
jgi:AraC-like DNA-binding protein